MLPPVGAALLVVALIALLIPVLVSRYVRLPIKRPELMVDSNHHVSAERRD